MIGPHRSLRSHLLVAATVNSVCAAQPGAPKVSALADGWLVTGASGRATLCATVDDVWAVVMQSFGDTDQLTKLLERAPLAADTEESSLRSRTIMAGRQFADHLHAEKHDCVSEPHLPELHCHTASCVH